VVLHPRLHAFAKHWRFRIRACAPYRARTKGKDERGVGYVKSNAIAGREVAVHAELKGRHGRITDDSHLAGIAAPLGRPVRIAVVNDIAQAPSALLRPLADYEAAIGGGF